jgi:D-serine deaminase-like pyridoxal phosphate-dependent protein
VDAGSKSISTDVIPVPDREAIPREEMASTLLNGHAQCLNWPGARFLTRNEEHLVIQLPEGVEQPRVGTLVYLVPRHVCSTVNLWDEMRVVDGEGRYCDTWPVDARGH